ncbi:glycosyltransferase [Paenibacillus sp. WQ 127069]|uniref:Glycosyltransferase n=1 Tax=Paenibacillus baimaensis TaxID=2982185 RepID=A0ABT2UGG0_9BACL|nr:glycosyltransferase [Paenibacillus sp. WQ 127069]MCU6793726.1 glycosyltransferase [Paenibacillus sp. WQ 127069]
MKTSIILLAQHISMVKQCLASIRRSTAGTYELIVINDGGSDEIDRLLSMDKKGIVTLTSQERIGVAAGYNLGAAQAKGDLLVFLRDHMTLSKGWLKSLTSCLKHCPDAAMVGPVSNGVSGVQHVSIPVPINSIEQLSVIARAFIAEHAGQTQRVTRLLSQMLAVRKSAYDKLGGFDERFGLESFEDDDFCYRAMQAGYGLYIAKDCFVRYLQPPDLFPDDAYWYGKLLHANKAKAAEKWGLDISQALLRWKNKITVSLCMIVKNEEQTLDRCLSSVSDLVDEIIIVDTGSDDQTKQIARKYTDRVFEFVWVNDFSKARNYAFSQATQEYILWLDADDVILPTDAEKFKELLAGLEWTVDSVSMNYILARDEYGNVMTSLRRNRLVKREKRFQWIGFVHEYLQVAGNIHYADINITHDRMHGNSDRNLHIYENHEATGELFSSRDLFYYGNELADHRLWERAMEKYDQFLQRPDGWVEDRIRACGRAADCAAELGCINEAKAKALQSFVYALPRAEICCRLGHLHIKEEKFEDAIFWYKLATELKKPTDSFAILQHSNWTWVPHLQLCVCYDRLGQRELAFRHNEIAAGFVPNEPSVVGNRAYFKGLGLA